MSKLASVILVNAFHILFASCLIILLIGILSFLKSIRNNFESPSYFSYFGNKNEFVLILIGMAYGIWITVLDKIYIFVLKKTELRDNFNHEVDYDYSIIIKRLAFMLIIGNLGLLWLWFVEKDFYTLRFQLIGLVIQKWFMSILFNLIFPMIKFWYRRSR